MERKIEIKADSPNSRKGKHLIYIDRIRIDTMYNTSKMSVIQIAKALDCSRSTVYRELERGKCYLLDSATWLEVKSYSPIIAQENYDYNKLSHGKGLKLGADMEFVKYIEYKICEDNYSPAAALAEIEREGLEFDTKICLRTLYNYIYAGHFLNIKIADLPYEHKRNKKRTQPVQKRATKGTSIEERSEEVQNRTEFGHWEMDTVIGKNAKQQRSGLVLIERKTRDYLFLPLNAHTQEEVKKRLDEIEKKIGTSAFKAIFKSITTDNGPEFLNQDLIQTSIDGFSQRTEVYYCHAYSSWEKGSVENANRLVRRWSPKGQSMNGLSNEDFKDIENWINNYPRQILGWRTPRELFEEELQKLGFAA